MSEVLQRKLDRERRKNQQLEELLETKTREVFLANRKLEGANTFLGSVLKCMSGALVVTNSKREIQLVNDRLTHLLGYEEAELSGTQISVLFPEAGSFTVSSESNRIEEETSIRTKAGEHIPVALATSKVQNEEEHAGHIYMAVDIRDRKAAEEALRLAQQQLIDASREAGKSEIAANVLHNVGNVLNAVNVSANVLDGIVRKSKVDSVSKVAKLLAKNSENIGDFLQNDPKGKKVPGFIQALSEQLSKEKAHILEEIGALLSKVDHVKDVVRAQQSFAKSSRVVEYITPNELVDSALSLSPSLSNARDVKIQKQLGDSRLKVGVDRNKVLQVLLNFLSNAHHAVLDHESNEKVITISATITDRHLNLDVIDNGVGIPKDNLDRVFEHGFSTKSEGHGFGLHSCANSVTELGGKISCASEGIGRGAKFSLSVPYETAKEPATC